MALTDSSMASVRFQYIVRVHLEHDSYSFRLFRIVSHFYIAIYRDIFTAAAVYGCFSSQRNYTFISLHNLCTCFRYLPGGCVNIYLMLL